MFFSASKAMYPIIVIIHYEAQRGPTSTSSKNEGVTIPIIE